jgi:nicotinate-nucleotide adenylyltransferase
MRIGIFGGTFNPIHLGHLRSAEEVREQQRLQRVLFVPSATPPHKGERGLASATDRLAMVRAAVAGNPHFRVSSIELQRSGRSYSVDTLRALHRRMPESAFFFILGADAFRDIATWHEYRSLFELCNLVVTSRPPDDDARLAEVLPVAVRREFCYRRRLRALEHRTGNRIFFQRISHLDISSSAIRTRLRAGASVRYLIPPAVERYILRHGLYTQGDRRH